VSDAGGAAGSIVAAAAEPNEARLVVSRSHASPALPAVLEQLGCREVARLGSSGLKGARVASGEADAYLALGSPTVRLPGTEGRRVDEGAAALRAHPGHVLPFEE